MQPLAEGSNAGEDIVNATNKGSNTFKRFVNHWNGRTISPYHLYQDVLNNGGSKQYAYETYLSKMNYPANANWGVESAPLGTVDVTTLQQTNGFQALANNGEFQQAYIIDAITDSEGNVIYQHEVKPVRVFSEAAASIVNDMLRSVINEKRSPHHSKMISLVSMGLRSSGLDR